MLAVAILGASVLLRLSTVFAVDGHAVSTLPPTLEAATRLLHRLSATGVALLALCAVTLCWTQRRLGPHLAWPVAWIVVATVILAVIGPLTPGYKVGAVTVANVSVGVVLLLAFWWLRERAATHATPRHTVDAFSWATIVALLAHIATGAAASAGEMHGLRWPAFVHLGSLVLAIILIVSLLIEQRSQPELNRYTSALAGLLATQLLVGYTLMWQDHRPLGLSFSHAMLTPLLAMALVSLVLRVSTRSPS